MLKFLSKKLKNNKGAMDNILVTLLFVILGVGLLVAYSSWAGGEKDKVRDKASETITSTLNSVN